MMRYGTTYLKMSDVADKRIPCTVDVGLKFRWWVKWVPFLRGHLIKKASRVLEQIQPAHVVVNVYPQPPGLRGWHIRKG